MIALTKIAHRGASAYEPENTMVSFQKAIDLHADMIELDVHLCQSGELVVTHDETVDRTTNGQGQVKLKTFTELESLTIRENEKIPLLQEVINLTKGKCLLNVEIKNPVAAQMVIQLFRKNELKEINIISSNYVSVLKTVKKSGLPVQRALVYYATKSDFRQTLFIIISKLFWPVTKKIIIQRAIKSGVQWINLDKDLATKKFVQKLKKLKFKVAVWVVNQPRHIKKLQSYGVDAIMSDYPDRL